MPKQPQSVLRQGSTLARQDSVLPFAVQIVSSCLKANMVTPPGAPELLCIVHSALKALESGEISAVDKPKPAVAPARSVHKDFIICLEDGKRVKMLKRYLRTAFGMSPEEYRRKWGLPAAYPMVAPAYAAQRSALAKRFGLGRRTWGEGGQ